MFGKMTRRGMELISKAATAEMDRLDERIKQEDDLETIQNLSKDKDDLFNTLSALIFSKEVQNLE